MPASGTHTTAAMFWHHARSTGWSFGPIRWLAFGLALGIAGAAPVTEQTLALEREVKAAGAAAPFNWLLRLSILLEAEDTQRAWSYAAQAREQASTMAERLRADLWIDGLLWRQGKHAEALKQAREGVARARSLGDDDLLARGLLVIASAQDRMADFPAAMETYRELLPLADKSPDLGLRSQVYDMFATTHFKTGNLEQTETNLALAKKFAEESGNPVLLPPVISHLGNLARMKGDVEGGRTLLEQSIQLRRENGGDTRGIADQEINLGAIAEDANDLPEALRHYTRAVELHSRMGFDLNHANARQCLAGILTRLGRTDEAQQQLEQALKLVEPTGSQTILARVYRELERVNETRGDFRAALGFAQKQAVAEDAALGERSRVRLDELNTRFEAEHRQNEIERLTQQRRLQQAEIVRERWQRYSLIAGAATLAAVVGVLAWRFRAERRLRLDTQHARIVAEEADHLKTRLLGIASHDLKGPLNAMMHGAESLERGDRSAEEIVVTARLIADTARRTHALVRDLIDVAALENGGVRLQFALVDVAALVGEVIATYQPLAAAKNQTVSFHAKSSDELLVEADALRLRQAVVNLVDNALKFTPPGKGITVTIGAEGGECSIEVIDEGPGLTPEDMVALFQPFRRLSSRPTGGESSSGLGLHLTREIVGLHGGRVVAESPAGAGAVFRIWLPMLAKRAAVAGGARTAPA